MITTTMECTIERRLLVNYRIQPEFVAALLPRPFRPQLISGLAVGGVCLIRLGGHLRIDVSSRDGRMQLTVAAATAGVLGSELFATLGDAVGFFRRGALGLSPSARTGRLDAVCLHSATWAAQPMIVEHIRSSLFDDTRLFPRGTCSLDSALVMRNLPARWAIHQAPTLVVP